MSFLTTYQQRPPTELILNSKRGDQIGNADGYKAFELQTEITARKHERLMVYLKKAFVPFSFYCISANQKNNKLDVKETITTGDISYTITIPDGNYTITTLNSEVKSLLEAGSIVGGHDFTYTITYEEATNKNTFILATGTNAVKTEFLMSSGSNATTSLFRVFGFASSDKEFTPSANLVSTYVCDVADGLDSLHIKSNLVGDNIRSTFNSVNGGEILIIPVDREPNNILFYDDSSNPFKHLLPQTSFKRIEIKFTDNHDNIVHFNNAPFTLILVVEYLFKEDELKSLEQRGLTYPIDPLKQIRLQKSKLFNLMINKIHKKNNVIY